jgi:hypothetical protein
MFIKKITRSHKREEDIVAYIEQQAGCAIPAQAREKIINELEVSIRLNGQVSQVYINNLIKAYRMVAQKLEAAIHAGNAASIAS